MANCSSEQQNPKGLDSTVGRLVWVRRGNGSWWPGQIMDVDESCLDVGKSSGVPIKLLGRDDVNVDWYNLEEAKQVKAFRCGEHNSCIEKAKASQANPSKRRLKRAARENAIILALELETALMSKDCDNCCEADNSDTESHQSWSKASPAMSYPSRDIDLSRNTSSSKENSDSTPELCRPDMVKRQRTPIYSEDNSNKGIRKRMRGLDELCVGSNMKQLTGLVTESVPQDPSSNEDLCPFNRLPINHMMNGSRAVCMAYFKKKRSKVVFQEILKRKENRDLLTKVLQSTTLVSVPIIYDELLSPCKSSSILCCNAVDNKKYGSARVSCQNGPLKYASEHAQDSALISNKLKGYDLSSMPELLGYDSSDNLFDVLLISEEELPDGFLPRITCSSLKPQIDALGVRSFQNSPVIVGSLTNEARKELGSTGSETARVSDVAQETENDPLEWQLKGKRNLRHKSRNPELDSKDDSKTDELDRYEILETSIRHSNAESTLYDVQIEAEARNRPQDVPNISLMTKLNRKPVSGHPIVVEVLEDGESDFLLDTLELYELDESTETRTRSSKTIEHGSSTKKTRTLSSLTRKPPTFACIPVKLLFSRIDEALNGSTRAVNRVC